MNAPSEDIKEMLEAYGDSSGLDVVYATNLFIGKEPTTPRDCITIFDTSGYPQSLTLDAGGLGYEYPSIQIRVRNKKYLDGWNVIHGIMTVLHGKSQEVWNGTLYTVIYCSSGPALLDWDDNGNARFIINFQLQRRAV